LVKNDEIIIKIEAVISKRKPTKLNPNSTSLSISGKAYLRVASGANFGFAGSFSSVEEAKRVLEE